MIKFKSGLKNCQGDVHDISEELNKLKNVAPTNEVSKVRKSIDEMKREIKKMSNASKMLVKNVSTEDELNE